MSDQQMIEDYLDEIEALLESDYPYDHPYIVDLERRIDQLMNKENNNVS